MWFSVQLSSDIGHISGRYDPKVKSNPYWPVPELSMFTHAGKHSEYRTALTLTCTLITALAAKYMLSARRRDSAPLCRAEPALGKSLLLDE
eukprot:6211163-Pleurochrysis_carterae.AAC.1